MHKTQDKRRKLELYKKIELNWLLLFIFITHAIVLIINSQLWK